MLPYDSRDFHHWVKEEIRKRDLAAHRIKFSPTKPHIKSLVAIVIQLERGLKSMREYHSGQQVSEFYNAYGNTSLKELGFDNRGRKNLAEVFKNSLDLDTKHSEGLKPNDNPFTIVEQLFTALNEKTT